MDTVITVIQVLLAFVFAMSGLLKLFQPYAKFAKLPAQGWANDFKPEQVRMIGIVEVSAAVGIIVPMFLHSLYMLTPLAAAGMALFMSGAMSTHLRRAEYVNIFGNLIWLGLALFVAYSTLGGLVV